MNIYEETCNQCYTNYKYTITKNGIVEYLELCDCRECVEHVEHTYDEIIEASDKAQDKRDNSSCYSIAY